MSRLVWIWSTPCQRQGSRIGSVEFQIFFGYLIFKSQISILRNTWSALFICVLHRPIQTTNSNLMCKKCSCDTRCQEKRLLYQMKPLLFLQGWWFIHYPEAGFQLISVLPSLYEALQTLRQTYLLHIWPVPLYLGYVQDSERLQYL